MHEWLIFSLALLGIWLIIFLIKSLVRKEMLWVSLFTMPLGLTEPIFVPAYWNPPSLFNLAAQTGFDVESLIFSFAIGGIASVLYEAIFKAKHLRMTTKEMHNRRHRFHRLAIISPALVFVPLYLSIQMNPIYSVSIAMFVGGIATILCRPDLKRKMVAGGMLFTILYFLFFFSINLVFPTFANAWNFSAISGIQIIGVPLEELMFAFTFGLMWSSIYEHIMWLRLK